MYVDDVDLDHNDGDYGHLPSMEPMYIDHVGVDDDGDVIELWGWCRWSPSERGAHVNVDALSGEQADDTRAKVAATWQAGEMKRLVRKGDKMIKRYQPRGEKQLGNLQCFHICHL